MLGPAYTATMEWSECDTDRRSPTIKNHSVTYFNDYLYCFGGYDGRKNHSSLMLYDLKQSLWIRPQNEHDSSDSNLYMDESDIVVQGTPPPGRNGHSATLAEDEDGGARIIIIGGWLGAGPLAASDMHVLEINGKQLRWYQPQIRGTPPGPCNMHSADYVRANSEVYVFRGGNGREYLNDLHALHVDTLTWRQVETVGAIPQQRANHSSSMMEETGELFIFGGWNGTERLNDIHILDIATSVGILLRFLLKRLIYVTDLDSTSDRWDSTSPESWHDVDKSSRQALSIWWIRNFGKVLSRLADIGSTSNGLA